MLDNNTYNLTLQLVEENKALWRIRNEYLRDAGQDSDMIEFWTKLATEKEGCIKELSDLVKKHL